MHVSAFKMKYSIYQNIHFVCTICIMFVIPGKAPPELCIWQTPTFSRINLNNTSFEKPFLIPLVDMSIHSPMAAMLLLYSFVNHRHCHILL